MKIFIHLFFHNLFHVNPPRFSFNKFFQPFFLLYIIKIILHI
jgi:hypothetical protein